MRERIKTLATITFQVRKVCGRSELEPSSSSERSVADAAGKSSSSIETHAAAAAPSRTLPSQLHVQLGNFLASVVRSRTFYGTLADTICEEYPDKRCWNGERVGEWVALFSLFFPFQRVFLRSSEFIFDRSSKFPFASPLWSFASVFSSHLNGRGKGEREGLEGDALLDDRVIGEKRFPSTYSQLPPPSPRSTRSSRRIGGSAGVRFQARGRIGSVGRVGKNEPRRGGKSRPKHLHPVTGLSISTLARSRSLFLHSQFRIRTWFSVELLRVGGMEDEGKY